MDKEKIALRNRIIGLLLRDAREKAGKTKRECAAVLGTSVGMIAAYEEGRKSISLPELEVLAYFLEVPIVHFWERVPEVKKKEGQVSLQEVMTLRHRIVGALVREAREKAGVSQKELAQLLGCSPRRLSEYEYGEHPMPLAELEVAARHLHVPLEHFLDTQEGPVGEWHHQQETFRRFRQLPKDVQEFVTHPLNVKYLEVAMKLAQMPAEGLRQIAEGLLDITY